MNYQIKIPLFALAVLSACSQGGGQGQFTPPPVPVLTAEALQADVPVSLESLGKIKASLVADVKPQVAGMITQVHFLEGQPVVKGDLLFSIDSKPYEIKVQEAEAVLAQDLSHLKNAEKKLERYKSLSKQNLISQVEWDELECKVAMYEALVEAHKARLAAANLELEHCQIVAPISGETGLIQVQEGNLVSASHAASLVTISAIDPLFVDFTLTEHELEWLPPKWNQEGLFLEVLKPGSNEVVTEGSLTFLDQSIDSHSGMVRARGKVLNAAKTLRSGQSVRVRLHVGSQEMAMLVPAKSVKMNQEGSYVFVVGEDQTVALRSVTIGIESGDRVVIEEGLKAGDIVITEGHLRLAPGAKVEDKSNGKAAL